MHVYLETGMNLVRDDLLRRLVDMLYTRNDHDFHRGTFRVRGDVVEIFPQYEGEMAIRVEFFGDEVEAIAEIDPLRGKVVARPKKAMIYPASHYVATQERIAKCLQRHPRLNCSNSWLSFQKENKLLEAQRLEQRTLYDLEMLETMGFCHGVENYSRWLDGREAGTDSVYALRLHSRRHDDRSGREPRLGSANRRDVSRGSRAKGDAGRLRLADALGPGQSTASLRRVGRARGPACLCLGDARGLTNSSAVKGVVVEQIIRPTGLIDPKIEIRPAKGQVDDLLGEIRSARRARRARSRDDPDQADGGGVDRLLRRTRRSHSLSA